jgi:hypothetical protein
MRAIMAVLILGVVSARAQDFVAPLPEAEEIVEVEPTRPSIEGIVKDIFTVRKPWQLVNPLAPKEYGSGENKVSRDFGGGTPVKSEGVVVLGVEW